MTLTHWQSPIPLGLQRSISDSSRCPAKRGTRCTPRTDVDATTFVRCCIHHPHHQLPPLRTWRPMPETTSTPCSQCHLHITHSHTKFKQAVFLLHKVLNGPFPQYQTNDCHLTTTTGCRRLPSFNINGEEMAEWSDSLGGMLSESSPSQAETGPTCYQDEDKIKYWH